MSSDQTTESVPDGAHVLKVVAPYFDALLDGSKTFEVRRNDRGFQRGDLLILWDYDPTPGKWRTYQPRECRAVSAIVSFVYSGDPRFTHGGQDALAPGWVVLGLNGIAPYPPEQPGTVDDEVDPCCALYREPYLPDHEYGCPALVAERARQEGSPT